MSFIDIINCGINISLFLLDNAVTVCRKQFAEVFNLNLQFHAFVGIANVQTAVFKLLQLHTAVNVGTLFHCTFLAFKCLVLNKLHTVAVINQCVSRNACGFVIRF